MTKAKKVKFVSYLRVSTTKQGISGLGIEAQRATVESFVRSKDGVIVHEFVENESGKKDDRPELLNALRFCRMHNATLLIAKLDRLARNVAFLARLMETQTKFVAADMPEADRTQLQFMMVFAEYEARMASVRTIAALAAAKELAAKNKKRGLPYKTFGGLRGLDKRNMKDMAAIGNVESAKVRSKISAAKKADVLPTIAEIQKGGATSLRAIAAALNELEIPTAREGGSGVWSAVQVKRILDYQPTA